jgi:CubicO group peptidase (beta-lactamase class C family)
MNPRSSRRRIAVLAFTLTVGGCANISPGPSIRIASASTSHLLCSAVFVSGRDADEAFQEEMRPEAGMGWIAWALRYAVDREHREVTTTIAGAFESRAIYRDGLGCLVVHGDVPDDAAASREARAAIAPPLLGETAGPAVVSSTNPRIRAAIDAAFAEPAEAPPRKTKAVVVLHRGRVIAERYAPGIDVGTAWHGHSVSKSVTHALVGILAMQGKLQPAGRAPITEWSAADDPRRAVTTLQLLRMTSGLPLARMSREDSTRMWFLERDMAGFAATRPFAGAPGERWAYSEGGYMLLSRIVRDAAGGSAADAVRLAHRELFGPLGMTTVTMEFDATGTPIGASHFYASPRDWARLGWLYLNDGVIEGRRLLPPGWARDAATPTATPNTSYGAGFWLNTLSTENPLGFRWGLPGAPADAYYGWGYLGQFVVIVPSRQLVVVRMGVTHRRGGDHEGVGRLVSEIVAALDAPVN